MPYPRRRRRSRPRAVIQSYKQLIQNAPASHAAATIDVNTMAIGVDSYTGPTAANNEVPTGAIIEKFDIQIAVQNLVNIASFVWVSIQHLRSGQAAINPRAAGGSPQRNQVHLMLHRCVGMNQNINFHIPFKVPRKYQRVREGDVWQVTVESQNIWTDSSQIIYKFLR